MSDRHIPNVLNPEDYASREQRAECAAGLRALADWLEQTKFPIPTYSLNVDFAVYSTWIDDAGFVSRPSAAARLIGGKVQKDAASSWFYLTRRFGGKVKFTYNIDRGAVCTPKTVQVPVEKPTPVDTVQAEVLAKIVSEAQAKLDALETVDMTVYEDRVEYECPPSLIEADRERVV